MKKNIIAICSIVLLLSCQSKEKEQKVEVEKKIQETKEDSSSLSLRKISFPSSDGILIQADLYFVNDSAPVIILCHQARFNKTEYQEIAPKLNELGFNCMAIDQRSGGTLNDSMNVTHERAMKKNLPVDFLDAEKDILAAIDYAYNKFGRKIILWGSSYSSTLALWIGMNNDKVEAVISFSPGDYFTEKGSLTDAMANFPKPMWVTSSLEEEPELTKMLSKMKKQGNQIQFIPKGNGEHGSKALWEEKPDHKEYWESIVKFLNQLKP